MVYRIYVEKKKQFADEAAALLSDIRTLLMIDTVTDLRLFNRYDVENIDEDLFKACEKTVFSEPQLDNTYAHLPQCDGTVFAVEFLPGQFDQRADSCAQCIQIVSQGEKPDGAHRKGLYAVRQDHARTACGGEKICHQPCGEPRGVLRPRGYFADPLQCSYRSGDAYRLYFAFRKGACRFCAEIRAGDGQRRHRVLPGLFQIRAPRSDDHGNSHDRHLLVGSLPAHHVPHDHRRRGDRRSDRAGGV